MTIAVVTLAKRTERALMLLGEDELSEIAKQKEGTTLTCQFCGKKYHYSAEEILALREEVSRQS